jgi:two-component system sensor histidine kinase KdpD
VKQFSLGESSIAGRYLLALAACAATTALALPLRDVLDLANAVMLMLLTVVLVAARLGRAQAIFASFVSVALFDYFFVPPRLSFAVSDVQYLVTFGVMLTVSLLIGHLTTSLQANAREAQARERRAQALYALARSLAGAMTVEQLVDDVAQFLGAHADGDVRFFLPDEDDELVSLPHRDSPPEIGESTAAAAVFHSRTGRVSGSLGGDGEALQWLPLDGATRCRGVMAVRRRQHAGPFGTQRPMLEAVASLAAIALERLHFVAVAQASQLETETERLRSSILSAISHDIRTPLTLLFGQADALAQADGHLTADEREAAQAIRDQARRLHEMVDKLLDMARLQAGNVRLRKEWQAVDDIVGASIGLLGDALRDHPLSVTPPPDLPLVAVDAVLIERVFCNLLENAAKYSPPGTPITVNLALEGDMLAISVCDHGRGFPPTSIARVFDVFERGAQESTIAGVGLGLAICRAIVEAHGGRIAANNRPEGGACVRFTLPCGEPPPFEPEAVPGVVA